MPLIFMLWPCLGLPSTSLNTYFFFCSILFPVSVRHSTQNTKVLPLTLILNILFSWIIVHVSLRVTFSENATALMFMWIVSNSVFSHTFLLKYRYIFLVAYCTCSFGCPAVFSVFMYLSLTLVLTWPYVFLTLHFY